MYNEWVKSRIPSISVFRESPGRRHLNQMNGSLSAEVDDKLCWSKGDESNMPDLQNTNKKRGKHVSFSFHDKTVHYFVFTFT